MFRVIDCIGDLFVAEPTRRQRIGNKIGSAMIFARADFVTVLNTHPATVYRALKDDRKLLSPGQAGFPRLHVIVSVTYRLIW